MQRKFLIPLLAAVLLAAHAPSDPWPAQATMRPADLVAAKPQPAIFYVGFPVLYRGAHIEGAILAGPGPKPEGLELLKKVKSSNPKVRTILLSAYSFDEDLLFLKYMEEGIIDSSIDKPVTIERLCQKVKDGLENYKKLNT